MILVIYEDAMKKTIAASAAIFATSALFLPDAIINKSVPSALTFFIGVGFGINNFTKLPTLNRQRKRVNEIMDSEQYS